MAEIKQLQQQSVLQAEQFVANAMILSCQPDNKTQEFFQNLMKGSGRLDAPHMLSHFYYRHQIHTIIGHHLMKEFPTRFLWLSQNFQLINHDDSKCIVFRTNIKVPPQTVDILKKSPTYREDHAPWISYLNQPGLNVFVKITVAEYDTTDKREYYIYRGAVNSMIFQRLTPHVLMMIAGNFVKYGDVAARTNTLEFKKFAPIWAKCTRLFRSKVPEIPPDDKYTNNHHQITTPAKNHQIEADRKQDDGHQMPIDNPHTFDTDDAVNADNADGDADGDADTNDADGDNADADDADTNDADTNDADTNDADGNNGDDDDADADKGDDDDADADNGDDGDADGDDGDADADVDDDDGDADADVDDDDGDDGDDVDDGDADGDDGDDGDADGDDGDDVDEVERLSKLEHIYKTLGKGVKVSPSIHEFKTIIADETGQPMNSTPAWRITPSHRIEMSPFTFHNSNLLEQIDLNLTVGPNFGNGSNDPINKLTLNLLMMENHPTGHNLQHILNEIAKTYQTQSKHYVLLMHDLLMITFQTLYTLSVMDEMQITHYDLHVGNIFYHRPEKPAQNTRMYILNNHMAFLTHPCSVQTHLNDWDLSYHQPSIKTMLGDFKRLPDYHDSLNIKSRHNIAFDLYMVIHNLYPYFAHCPTLENWMRQVLSCTNPDIHQNVSILNSENQDIFKPLINENAFCRMVYMNHKTREYAQRKIGGDLNFATSRFCYVDMITLKPQNYLSPLKCSQTMLSPIKALEAFTLLLLDPLKWQVLQKELIQSVATDDTKDITPLIDEYAKVQLLKKVDLLQEQPEWPMTSSEWWCHHVYSVKDGLIAPFQQKCHRFSPNSSLVQQW